MIIIESTAYGLQSLLGFLREATDDNCLHQPVRWWDASLEYESACFCYSEL